MNPRHLVPVVFVCALVAAGAAVGVPAKGASAISLDPVAGAWRDIVGDGRGGSALPVDVIVVLRAPAIADAPPGDPNAAVAARRAQDAALGALAQQGIDLRVSAGYLDAINAVAATVGPDQLAALRAAAQVRGVYPDRQVYAASVVDSGSLSSLGDAARPAAVDLPQRGSGVRVALLDGPIDQAHPYLAGALAPAWDAITGRLQGVPTPAAARHATAMAGIVAGARGPDGLRGVAPAARLLPVQVLELQHGVLVGSTSSLLAGIERALDPNGDGDLSDHADVILAPVAEPFAGFDDSPESLAGAAAQRLGVTLVAPAGNDGASGARFGTLSGPGSAPSWLGVGAVDGRTALPQVGVTLSAGPVRRDVSNAALLGDVTPDTAHSLPVVDLAGPTLSDPSRAAGLAVAGTDAGDYQRPDGSDAVTGSAVLVPRDGASLEQKAAAAAAAGASALLVYGDGPVADGSLGLSDRVPIPVVSVPSSFRAAVLGANGPVTASFSAAEAPANPDAGSVAAFSSRGLAFDDAVKPDVVAPGVAITSALAGGGYAAVSGTSAAAAQVAGDVAILRELHPAWTPQTVTAALVGSAHQVPGTAADASALGPVEAQGGGLADVQAAAGSELAAEPAELSFGATAADPVTVSRTVVLHNLSDHDVSVDLGFVRDGVGDGQSRAALTADHPHVTVPAGGSTSVVVTVAAADLPLRPSVLGGWIVAGPLRIPWALATAGRDLSLVRQVQLSPARFTPSAPGAPPASQLAIALGSLGSAPGALDITPVSRLTIDLVHGKRSLGRLIELHALLPGVYRYGISGRDPAGHLLPAGRYVLHVEAAAPDGVTSVRDVPFVVAGD